MVVIVLITTLGVALGCGVFQDLRVFGPIPEQMRHSERSEGSGWRKMENIGKILNPSRSLASLRMTFGFAQDDFWIDYVGL